VGESENHHVSGHLWPKEDAPYLGLGMTALNYFGELICVCGTMLQ
jgi:hypothetical protein